MKNRIVLWGTDSKETRVMIAMELLIADNKVDLFVIPEEKVSNDFDEAMHKNWRMGETVPFPEGIEHRKMELSLAEGLMPNDLRTTNNDIVTRAQTEWHFIVLSAKLYEAYRSELEQIDTHIRNLESYSNDAWNDLKDYWDKVMAQVRERNLYRDQADDLKDLVNDLFGVLKEKRSSMDDIFKQQSKAVFDEISKHLNDIESRIASNARFKAVFDDLKRVQSIFRESKMTRDHSNDLWARIDNAFKKAKEQKFGDTAESNGSERVERRFEGLMQAISKMQESIDRDVRDLEYEQERIANTEGQLEAQIRVAKMAMIKGRVDSKQEKLNEMLQTKLDLEQKMEQVKQRELKILERQKAEQRIQDEMKERSEAASKTEPASVVPKTTTAAAAIVEATPALAVVETEVVETEVADTETVAAKVAEIETISTEVEETEAPEAVIAVETPETEVQQAEKPVVSQNKTEKNAASSIQVTVSEPVTIVKSFDSPDITIVTAPAVTENVTETKTETTIQDAASTAADAVTSLD